MNIEQLPVEMLMKIFNFLPTYNEVALVSKQFYSIACQVSTSTNYVRINRRFLERFSNNGVMDSECVQSLRTSDRKVSKLELGVCSYDSTYDHEFSNSELEQIVFIIEKFASTIKYFKCTNIKIDECTLTRILSLMPNVEHLHLDGLTFRRDENENHSEHRVTNTDLNLTKLTSLTLEILSRIPEKLVEFFSRLPIGILTDLHVMNFLWDEINSVLIRQWNIKNLKLENISVIDVKTDIFEKLQLESLHLYLVISPTDLATILLNQTKLKSLNLCDIHLNEGVMNALADCLTLETLAINVSCVPLEWFRKLEKLKKLKDLTLIFSYSDNNNNAKKLECFADWDNVSLQKLSLKPYKRIPGHLLSVLAKSVPHLKHLKVDNWPNMGFGCSTAEEAIMNYFSFVEVLKIKILEEPNWESNYLNPNLRELEISVDGMYYEQWLSKCIAAYPNLQKLQMKISPKINEQIVALKLRPILNGFTKLVSLNLTASNLIVDDLDYLQNQKENLKFVSLRRSFKENSGEFRDDAF